jgi:hypothetical protein
VNLLHIIIGALITAAAALHIILHWKWTQSVVFRSAKDLPEKVRANRTTFIWLSIPFVLCVIMGIITALAQSQILNISRLTIDDLEWLHRLTGMVAFVPMVVHVIQNWKWYTAIIKRGLGRGTDRKLVPQLGLREE